MKRVTSPRDSQAGGRPSIRFVRRRLRPSPTFGSLYPLAVLLITLHGCGYVSADETNVSRGEFAGNVVESCKSRLEGVENTFGAGAGGVAGFGKTDTKSIGRKCKAMEPDVEGAEAVAGGTGEVVAKGGGCSGRRFKKCR